MTTLQCKKNHWSVHHMARLPGKVRIVGAEAGWPPVRGRVATCQGPWRRGLCCHNDHPPTL